MKWIVQMTWVVLILVGIGLFSGTIVTAQPIKAPATITTPGLYELEADARGITDIYGIKIECSDVVLDGAGHFLGGEQREKSAGIYVNQYGGSITNITVKNVVLEDWETGIDYKYVKGDSGDSNLITGCDIVNSNIGIHIEYSDYIDAHDNQIHDCSSGIIVEGLSTYTKVSKNTIKGAGLGVGITNSMHSTLNENNINTCSVYGLEVVDSEYTTITKNGISDNKYAAIRLENSKHSVLTGNNLSQTEVGPALIIGNEVRDAVITNNYFGSYENVAVDDVSSEISWNSTQTPGVNILGGPYLGGNYWGSASGSKGFSDSAPDRDGFGISDDSFRINDYNVDYLPLTHTTATKAPEEQQDNASVKVSSDSEDGESLSDGNQSPEVIPQDQTPVITSNASQSNITAGTEPAPVPSVSKTPEPSPVLPSAANSTLKNETSSSEKNMSVSNESILNKSVANSYSNIPLVQTLGIGADAMIPDLRSQDNSSSNTTPGPQAGINSNVNGTTTTVSAPASVGYLLFTVSQPGGRVTLTTKSGSEIKLDPMEGNNLSVPVPVEGLVYLSYLIEKDGFTAKRGNISPYPASGETVSIPVTLIQMESNTSVSQQVQRNVTLPSTPIPTVEPPVISVPGHSSPLSSSETANGSSVAVNSSSMANQAMVVANGAVKTSVSSASHMIRASAGPGGAVLPDGTISVHSGDSANFAITADKGRKVAYLVIDGIQTSPMSEYRFMNVTSDHTLVAGFT